jgi:15-cis-phytoene desaturase
MSEKTLFAEQPNIQTDNTYDAIVIGAGLAGLSAAFDLVEQGLRVLVLERDPHVGGRTSSWKENGMNVESGIHKFVGFYSEYKNFLERAGLNLDDVFIYQDEIEIRVAEGGDKNYRPGKRRRAGRFGVSGLHRPLMTIGGALGNSELLSWRDKWQLVRLVIAGTAQYLRDPLSLDRLSIAEYARQHGVSENVIYTVIWTFSSGLFFLSPERYSAYPFFALTWAGIKGSFSSRIAIFRGGMTDVMAGPIADAIIRRGGEVRTSVKAERILFEDGKATGVGVGEHTFSAPRIVLATTIAPAKAIIEASENVPHDTELEKLRVLPDMSGVTVQLELDSPALPDDHVIFGANSILGTFGEQSHTTFPDSKGRISTFLTPTEPYIDMEDAEIVAAVVADLKRQGIDVEGRVTNSAVVRHASEFYLLEPGSEELRPFQRTSIAGLALAGDYTRQSHICSMEGAVVSGRRAAKALIQI